MDYEQQQQAMNDYEQYAQQVMAYQQALINAVGYEQALINAVIRGNATQVQHYLDQGTDINYPDSYNSQHTPLCYSILRGHLDVMQLLLTRKANVNQRTMMGDNALQVAIFEHNRHSRPIETIVGLLLKHGAHFDEPQYENAYRGNEQALFQCLREASINQKDSNGYTVLHYAAAQGHLQIVKRLCQQGAELCISNNSKLTPLMVASRRGHLETVQYLLAHGASVSAKDRLGGTALIWAAHSGRLEIVQWLLAEGGATITEKKKGGGTALLAAADGGHLETVEWLLSYGVSLIEKDNNCVTALLWAASSGHIETVQWLLKHGATITEKDNYGATALLLAAQSGELEMVKWLLAHGASITEKDSYGGTTALLYASREGHLETVKWLLSNGASITEKDSYGETALFYAAGNGHLETVQWLLLHGGASISERGTGAARNTALKTAREAGHEKVVDYLIRYKAFMQGACQLLGVLRPIKGSLGIFSDLPPELILRIINLLDETQTPNTAQPLNAAQQESILRYAQDKQTLGKSQVFFIQHAVNNVYQARQNTSLLDDSSIFPSSSTYDETPPLKKKAKKENETTEAEALPTTHMKMHQ